MTIPIVAESLGVLKKYLRPERRRARWLVTAAVLAGTVCLVSGALLIRRRAAAVETWNTPSRSLRVERFGAQLRLIWNRNSLAIRRADRGRLLIEDGGARREIPLDASHLQLGSITYAPVSSQVRFQVDLSAPGQNDLSESVIVRQAAAGPQPPAPRPPARVAPQQAPVVSATLPAKPKPLAPVPNHQPQPPAPRPPARVAPQQAPVVSATLPAKPKPLAPVRRHQPKPPDPDPQPAELSPSVAPAGYERPRPVKEVAPLLSSALRPVIVRPVTVEVEVSVDVGGNVVGARPAGSYRASESVIEAAVHAARQWKFQPARKGDHTVPSAIILRFRFKPGG